MLFDYADHPWRARYTQLILAPGAEMPARIATAMTDFFAMAEGTCAGDEAAGSGSCVRINAESEMKPLRLIFWRARPGALARRKVTVRPSCGVLARLCQNRRNG